nr:MULTISPECIES: hotdog fold domain-containing protein [unclassified Marinobacter]
MSSLPMGRQLFSKGVCIKAPYFNSIKPLMTDLRPGKAEVQVKKHRAIQNHLGTVHAIAMCNMAELAGGMMTDVSIPTTHRWIPKGMKVEYLSKATSDLTAVATGTLPDVWPDADEFTANVDIKDRQGVSVARMEIAMWVSVKKK